MKLKQIFPLFIVLFACNANETPAGNQFSIKKGESFTIHLKSNPSTGNQWYLLETPYHVDSIQQKYKGEMGGIGSGGMEYWTFKGKETGMDTLQFIYAREGESYGGEYHPRKFIVQVQ